MALLSSAAETDRKNVRIDAIAWALGGNNYKPSVPERDGALVPPNLHIELSNGLIVERKGKNSTLKVTDPNGNKSGQQLLNEFVSTLALISRSLSTEAIRTRRILF